MLTAKRARWTQWRDGAERVGFCRPPNQQLGPGGNLLVVGQCAARNLGDFFLKSVLCVLWARYPLACSQVSFPLCLPLSKWVALFFYALPHHAKIF